MRFVRLLLGMVALDFWDVGITATFEKGCRPPKNSGVLLVQTRLKGPATIQDSSQEAQPNAATASSKDESLNLNRTKGQADANVMKPAQSEPLGGANKTPPSERADVISNKPVREGTSRAGTGISTTEATEDKESVSPKLGIDETSHVDGNSSSNSSVEQVDAIAAKPGKYDSTSTGNISRISTATEHDGKISAKSVQRETYKKQKGEGNALPKPMPNETHLVGDSTINPAAEQPNLVVANATWKDSPHTADATSHADGSSDAITEKRKSDNVIAKMVRNTSQLNASNFGLKSDTIRMNSSKQESHDLAGNISAVSESQGPSGELEVQSPEKVVNGTAAKAAQRETSKKHKGKENALPKPMPNETPHSDGDSDIAPAAEQPNPVVANATRKDSPHTADATSHADGSSDAITEKRRSDNVIAKMVRSTSQLNASNFGLKSDTIRMNASKQESHDLAGNISTVSESQGPSGELEVQSPEKVVNVTAAKAAQRETSKKHKGEENALPKPMPNETPHSDGDSDIAPAAAQPNPVVANAARKDSPHTADAISHADGSSDAITEKRSDNIIAKMVMNTSQLNASNFGLKSDTIRMNSSKQESHDLPGNISTVSESQGPSGELEVQSPEKVVNSITVAPNYNQNQSQGSFTPTPSSQMHAFAPRSEEPADLASDSSSDGLQEAFNRFATESDSRGSSRVADAPTQRAPQVSGNTKQLDTNNDGSFAVPLKSTREHPTVHEQSTESNTSTTMDVAHLTPSKPGSANESDINASGMIPGGDASDLGVVGKHVTSTTAIHQQHESFGKEGTAKAKSPIDDRRAHDAAETQQVENSHAWNSSSIASKSDSSGGVGDLPISSFDAAAAKKHVEALAKASVKAAADSMAKTSVRAAVDSHVARKRAEQEEAEQEQRSKEAAAAAEEARLRLEVAKGKLQAASENRLNATLKSAEDELEVEEHMAEGALQAAITAAASAMKATEESKKAYYEIPVFSKGALLNATSHACMTAEPVHPWSWLLGAVRAGTPCLFGVDPRDEGAHCIEKGGSHGKNGWCYTDASVGVRPAWGPCAESCSWAPTLPSNSNFTKEVKKPQDQNRSLLHQLQQRLQALMASLNDLQAL